MKFKNFDSDNGKTAFKFVLDFFANLFFTYCLIIGLALIMFSSVTIECEVVGASMVPTYNNSSGHDIVFVNTLDKDVSYGDIVVCKTSDDSIIKRVIGVAGDTIDIVMDKNEYKVELNGKIIVEDYIMYRNDPKLSLFERNGMNHTNSRFSNLKESKPELFNEFGKLVVPENSIFVLGDNREVSVDSSSLGVFTYEDLEGQVELTKYSNDSDFAFYYYYIVEGKFINTFFNMF